MSHHSDDDESGEESHGVNVNSELLFGSAGSEDDHYDESESSVYGSIGGCSSSSGDSEYTTYVRDEKLEQFAMNFHRGNYDGEIDSALSSVADDGGTMNDNDTADQPRPPNWEELMEIALIDQRKIMRNIAEWISASPVDVGVLNFGIHSRDTTKYHYEGETLASHEQSLDSYWNEISKAVDQRSSIQFEYMEITGMPLTKKVMKMLAESFGGKVRGQVLFYDANLCGEGIKSLSTLLDNNPELHTLALHHNPMEDLNAIRCLSRSVSAHSRLTRLHISYCDLGNNVDILSAICHPNMQEIELDNNNIGSVGARVISDFLQTNPRLRKLTLNHNRFDDDDAILFSKCLKMNSNLVSLGLEKNKFTSSGVKSLIAGVFDSSSLNAISGSNHNCYLHLLPGFSIVQDYIDNLSQLCRKGKVWLVLHARESLLKYLDDVPEELMPDVLAFFQAEKYQTKLLNMIYAMVRWWSMPSLYSYHSEPKTPKRKRSEVE